MKRTASIGLFLAAAALNHANANAQTCVPSYNTRCNVTQEVDLIDGQQDGRYCANYNGAGVDIYIVDHGFGGANQAIFGNRYTNSGYVQGPPPIPAYVDNGSNHGFDMANAAAGAIYGVASGANIKQVRVSTGGADPDGSLLRAALTWLRDERIKLNGAQQTEMQPRSIVSISLTRENDPALNTLIRELVDRGLPVFVSAGNSGLNSGGLGQAACNFSPAGETAAFTVSSGSVGELGGREYYANYGACVDGFVYAPDTPFGRTSQSTARAAGVAALIWQEYPTLTGAQVVAKLIARAEVDAMPAATLNGSANLVVTSVPRAIQPSFLGVKNKLCLGRKTLQWLDSGPHTRHYELQSSSTSDFSTAVDVNPGPGLNQTYSVDVGAPTYYRVRACNGRECSPYTIGNRAATHTTDTSGCPTL